MSVKDVLVGIAEALNPLDGIKDTITDVIHSIKGDPAVLKELQLREIEARLKVDQAKAEARVKLEAVWMKDAESLREQIKIELQSEDPFVRRARPAWLWGLLCVYLINYGLTTIANWFGAGVVPMEMPVEVHYLTGGLVLGYGYLRTIEKRGAKPPLSK